MHHLFLVHSQVTCLAAMAVVEALDLDPARVVLLRDRGARVPDGVRSQELPSFPGLRTGIAFWRARRALAGLDAFLADCADGPFTLYLPHTRSEFAALALTHPACAGFNYIEEGLLAYRPKLTDAGLEAAAEPGMARRALRWLSFGARGRFVPCLLAPGADAAFAFSEAAFPGWPSRRVLDFAATMERQEGPRRDIGLRPGDVVAVIDALAENRLADPDQYRTVMVGALRDLAGARRDARLCLRRHPAQVGQPAEFDRLVEALRRDLPEREVRIDWPDLPLEAIGYHAPEAFFLVGASSASIYLSLLGATPVSVLDRIDLAYRGHGRADTLGKSHDQLVEARDILAQFAVPLGQAEGRAVR